LNFNTITVPSTPTAAGSELIIDYVEIRICILYYLFYDKFDPKYYYDINNILIIDIILLQIYDFIVIIINYNFI